MRPAAGRQFGLDALRALAVLLVVIAHGSVLVVPLWIPDKGTIFLAFLGVELFFVLSGFLVGGLLLDALAEPPAQRSSTWVRDFWARRWLRTLPNYYLVLLLNFAFVLVAAQPVPEQWPLYWVFSQNLVSPHPNFFGEAWSLAVEEWFYLLAPLVALLCAPVLRSQRAVIAGFAALLLGGLLLRVGAVLVFDPSWDDGVRKLTALRLDSIAYGVLIVWLLRNRPRLYAASGVLCLLGMVALAAASALYFGAELDSSLMARSLLFSLCSLGCALLLPIASRWSGSPLPAWLRGAVVQLALLSYSIYLLHMLVVRGFLHGLPPPQTWTAVLASCTAYALLSWSAAWLLYRSFERPILRLRDRWVPR